MDVAARPIGLLVLGMHRSGTSALTRAMNLLGAALPSDLIEPTARNPLGFWEWEQTYRLHNEVLADLDMRWDDWDRIDERWFASSAGADAAQRLAGLLEAEFGERALFVAKDPRACRLTPLWFEAAELARIQLRPILILRNPLEVAQSLAAGKGMQLSQALLVWLRYVLDSEAATRGGPRVVLTYDALLRNWRTVMTRTSQELGVSWPYWTEAAAQKVDAFLDPGERHHVDADGIADSAIDAHVWVRRAYEALEALAAGQDPDSAMATLDQVTAEFDVACQAFFPLYRFDRTELEQARRKRESAERGLEAVTARLEERLGDVSLKLERRMEDLRLEKAQRKRLERRLARLQGLEPEPLK